jgi:hypothetical protein
LTNKNARTGELKIMKILSEGLTVAALFGGDGCVEYSGDIKFCTDKFLTKSQQLRGNQALRSWAPQIPNFLEAMFSCSAKVGDSEDKRVLYGLLLPHFGGVFFYNNILI